MSRILLLLCCNTIAVHTQVPWNWQQQSSATGLGNPSETPAAQYQVEPTRQDWLFNGQNGGEPGTPLLNSQGSFSPNGWSGSSINGQSSSSFTDQHPLNPPKTTRDQKGGRMVRQCSCDETSQCVDQMKSQGEQCIQKCWIFFDTITSRPHDLRRCYEGKADLINNYVQCFKDSMQEKGCAYTTNGPLIPRQEINDGKFILTINDPLLSLMLAPLQKVIDSAGDFGNCVKECFHEKNPGGVCLKQFDCQPTLPTASKAQEMFKLCSSGNDLKKEGIEMCNCAANAGVSDLKFYCPLISIFTG